MGLEGAHGSNGKEEFQETALELVELVFNLVRPHTVALFSPADRDLRLVAVKSREPDIVAPGFRISLSDRVVQALLLELGEIWIRELSDRAHRVIPIYKGEAAIHSIRILPVPIDPEAPLRLWIDYTDFPEADPLEQIEPLLHLFSRSVPWSEEDLYLNRKAIDVPIPVFLRRILKLFIDITADMLPIESLGLVLWGPPASEGEILEVIGERKSESTGTGEKSFELGPFRFHWSIGGLRKLSSHNRATEERGQYYPLRIGKDVVGNLSIVTDSPGYDSWEHMVRIVSWSIRRELKLIHEFVEGRGGIGMPNDNPYRAVIRVLDEWSNASRYNEYLSLGLVELRVEAMDVGSEPWKEVERIDNSLWNEVDEILRTGDILAHCSKGKMALIFPRTSPEGAENALRRLRNLLEGKKLSVNGSSVRVQNAEYSVLCYPRDLPTRDVVLEKCSLVFLPSL